MNVTRCGNSWTQYSIVAAKKLFRRHTRRTSAKKPGCTRALSHPFFWRTLDRALTVFTLLFLPILNLQNVFAQTKAATPNVLDMSVEDLMSIEIDSVYGASGFKQKVTEAPASVTIISSDDIQKHGYLTS
jgi:hypothetical protein